MPFFSSEKGLFIKSSFYKFFPKLIFHIARKKNIKRIEQYLVENKIQAILCEYGPCGVEMMKLCKKLNIPLFVYFHGFDVYRAGVLKRYKSRYEELFTVANKIFVVSNHMHNQLLNWGAPAHKLVYNPCGADTDLFLPANKTETHAVFFAAGRFEETKCPQNTIAAFALVTQKFPDVKLIMAGSGSLLKKCKRLATKLNVYKNVKFVGVLSHASIAEQMKKSRAFVQHSVTAKNGDKEGTPVAIMEAGACGVPVISTKHGGIEDVVIDGVTGILVNEHDINAMANAMMKMLAEPHLAHSMGYEARKVVVEKFSQNESLRRLWSEIEKDLN
jgi:colanic acid/amylovoran biosynthesis glycosyltransferase